MGLRVQSFVTRSLCSAIHSKHIVQNEADLLMVLHFFLWALQTDLPFWRRGYERGCCHFAGDLETTPTKGAKGFRLVKKRWPVPGVI